MMIERVRSDLEGLVAAGAVGALAQIRVDGDESSAASGVVSSAASGVVELGADLPVDPAGYFRIGSVSKTFTAVAVMQLVGDGVLRLDDSVEQWLPGVVPGGELISVRRLLDHTAGLFNYTNTWFNDDGMDVEQILADRLRRWTNAEVVALATAHEPQFAPGSSLAYNNTGYLVAAMVIEAAGGQAYEEHVTDRILSPLDLKHTVVRPASEIPEPHAHGYLDTPDGPVDITIYDRSVGGAAGGFVSTAGDVNGFFAGLLRGDLLGAAELAEMLAPTPWTEAGFDAGLGMIRTTLPNGAVVIGKDGSFHGYHTWSFHTLQANRQLTVSATTATDVPINTASVLATFAYVFA